MTATKKYQPTLEGLRPEEIESFRSDPRRWALSYNGQRVRIGTDFAITSPYGAVESAVVVDEHGRPVFDRPLYREAPNVNIVAWGRTQAGEARLAVIRQPRPHADDPEQPGNEHAPVVFGQIPMGFLKSLIGEDLEGAAIRETSEETGARAVKNVTQPAYPWHNPNPTFVATWSDLYFVEVDLDQIEALKPNRREPIFSAEYVSVPELLRCVKEGKDDQGAVYRMCTANSILLIFFATYPELWPR